MVVGAHHSAHGGLAGGLGMSVYVWLVGGLTVGYLLDFSK